MSGIFHDPHTGRDLRQLKKLLEAATGANTVGKPASLLNLACGRADETGVLADVFGKSGIHLTGLDIRDRELDLARERWKKLLPASATAEFHVQDGTRLGDMKELRDDFDIVFMRHQNYWNGDTTWRRIYSQALQRLDRDGQLVITSYFDREHRQALDAIRSLGAELVTDIRNARSRVLSRACGKSVDRHVAVFRRPR